MFSSVAVPCKLLVQQTVCISVENVDTKRSKHEISTQQIALCSLRYSIVNHPPGIATRASKYDSPHRYTPCTHICALLVKSLTRSHRALIVRYRSHHTPIQLQLHTIRISQIAHHGCRHECLQKTRNPSGGHRKRHFRPLLRRRRDFGRSGILGHTTDVSSVSIHWHSNYCSQLLYRPYDTSSRSDILDELLL